MEEWYHEVGQLQVQVSTIPQQTQIKETVAGRQAAVEARMVRLIEPLKERRRILLASKEVHQVGRDLEDEIVSLMIQYTLTHTSLKKTHKLIDALHCCVSHCRGCSCGSRSASQWPCLRSTAPLCRRSSSS